MSETPKNPEKVGGVLSKAFLMGLALHTTDAKAFEIPENTSWEKGLAIVRHGVANEQHETAGTAVAYIDAKGKRRAAWIRSNEGGNRTVTVRPEDVQKAIEKQNARGIKVTFVCDFHTHNVAPSLFSPNGKNFTFSAPPGRQDVNYSIYFPTLQTRNGEIPFYQAVADYMGVWYFRPFTREEASKRGVAIAVPVPKEDIKRSVVAESATVNWMQTNIFPKENVKDPAFIERWRKWTVKEQLPELKKAYARHGVLLEYVTYEEAAKEEPCSRILPGK